MVIGETNITPCRIGPSRDLNSKLSGHAQQAVGSYFLVFLFRALERARNGFYLVKLTIVFSSK